jgi:hypothetical protein
VTTYTRPRLTRLESAELIGKTRGQNGSFCSGKNGKCGNSGRSVLLAMEPGGKVGKWVLLCSSCYAATLTAAARQKTASENRAAASAQVTIWEDHEDDQ